MVKDVRMHVRTSKTRPSDSSGGSGFGGSMVDMEETLAITVKFN
jgi:hypothetical protein